MVTRNKNVSPLFLPHMNHVRVISHTMELFVPMPSFWLVVDGATERERERVEVMLFNQTFSVYSASRQVRVVRASDVEFVFRPPGFGPSVQLFFVPFVLYGCSFGADRRSALRRSISYECLHKNV